MPVRLISTLLLGCLLPLCKKNSGTIYKNAHYSNDERARDLLSGMSVEEKVAQTLSIREKIIVELTVGP